MPMYNFICPVHGIQERVKCSSGQKTIQCDKCAEIIPRAKQLHRAGFTVNGNGTYDNGTYKAK